MIEQDLGTLYSNCEEVLLSLSHVPPFEWTARMHDAKYLAENCINLISIIENATLEVGVSE